MYSTLVHSVAPLHAAQSAVILLHGRGSSGQQISRLSEAFDAPNVAYLAPSAEGGSWYPQRFLAPLDANQPALRNALGQVEQLVQEVLSSGIPVSRLGLIGFSQGACLALEHASHAGRPYGFVAGLSGALIGPLETKRSDRPLNGLPVYVGCAKEDAHIPLPHVELTIRHLKAQGAQVTGELFPGDAHQVFPSEIEWINKQLTASKSR
ncbi:MAG: dienelactone hydrolase family protein [Opitutaceae bacterium]|nr:dienelactone hydrolase family protein [Opitutaceae bacterium]